MSKAFKPGERVAALRNLVGTGTVLDYSGVISSLGAEGKRAEVRFRDGEIESRSTHPDFMSSMEPAYRLATRFLAESDSKGGIEATEENIARAAGDHRPSYFDAARALWVVRYDPEGAR